MMIDKSLKFNMPNLVFNLFLVFLSVQILHIFFFRIPFEGSFLWLGLLGILSFVFEIKYLFAINNKLIFKAVLRDFIVFGFIFFSILLQFYLLNDVYDLYGRSSLFAAQVIAINAVCNYYIGVLLVRLNVISNLSKIFLIIGALIFLYGLYLNLDGSYILSYEKLSELRTGDGYFDHLSLGEPVVLIFIFLLGISKQKIRGYLFIIFIILLVMLGGRAALFFFMASYIIVDMLVANRGDFKYKILFSLLIAVLMVSISIYISIIGGDGELMRIFFSGGLTNDASMIGRSDILSQGISLLFKQFFIGDPTLIAVNHDNVGSYLHNLLSAWQFFGFPVFLTLLFLIFKITSTIVANKNILKRSYYYIPIFIFIFIYSILSIVFSKAINFGIFWLALGLWSRLEIRMKNDENYILRNS